MLRSDFADGSSREKIGTILSSAEVAFCAGRAGVRILDQEQLRAAPSLIVAADVNAVPPSGVEGLKMEANGEPIGESQDPGCRPAHHRPIEVENRVGAFSPDDRRRKNRSSSISATPSTSPVSWRNKARYVLIAALSGRALAVSARQAGYAPLVADLFGDEDMRAAASQCDEDPGRSRVRAR